ncbi:ABC transporter ATP-binding protein [Enhydrobacter sp.]|jgi:branched-chain amino acid transport system ATP-binding protein|uniref:ABC transporter ATP-binding protein n=1 Tax=Enhydrobacter sp. TaxID=1894999 RepID=UPI00262B3841|nr:ABC transporter ATP-binding protein [Enhydrobacter sp.]WIM09456.1 MAG: Urea ABC transporter, ATPase protein UrtE [Enhydrobacter sp.]
MLEVRDLHAAYGRIPILHGVTFAVAEGQSVGVLGHNGMGKTSLLRALMGFLPLTGGAVVLDQADITDWPPYRRARAGIGYVPQGRDIFPNLSVLDNLRMGCAKEAGSDRPVIDSVLADFPRLRRLLDRLGGALSGGEQQLLAIARCLCGKPALLLLDEPTEGIQPSIIDEIIELLTRLRRSRRLTVVLVEQNLDFIAALSDRILLIQKGRITREVSPGHLQDPDLIGEFVGVER